MANIKSHNINLYAWSDTIFTDAEIDRIVEIGLNQKLEESKIDVAATALTGGRLSTNAWLYPDSETEWLYTKMRNAIDYMNQRFFNYDINLHEPFQFASYDSARKEFYGRHLDTIYGEASPAASRKLSITLQLTDGNSYEGGDLVLYQSDQPNVAPKKKGMLVVFPSFIMHEVTPVTEGTRHSLVTWCHGPLFR